MEVLYQCNMCGSTNTYRKPEHETVEEFQQHIPEKVICPVRGCGNYQYPVS